MVAMVRASPRKRSAKPGSSSSAGSKILTATVRPSTSSVPRHTSPIPPPAIRSSRRYRPPNVIPGLTMPDTSFLAPPLDDRVQYLFGDAGRLAAAGVAGVLEAHRD